MSAPPITTAPAFAESAPSSAVTSIKSPKRPFRSFRPRKPVDAFPPRSSTEEVTPVDLAAIPVANAEDLGTSGSKFALKRLDLTPHNCPPHTRAPKRITYSLDLVYSPQPALIAIGNVILPERRFLDGLHETKALDRIATSGRLPVTWVSVARTGKDDAVDVTELDGTYDGASGESLASSKVKVHSPTLLANSGLYAFRRCIGHCDDPTAKEEELTLIGPPAVWVGSSEESVDHTVDKRTPFTRLTVPLRAGTSATLEIVVFDDDIVRFEKTLPRLMTYVQVGKTNHWTSLSLEVVWPEGDASPTLTVFVSHASGEVSSIRDDIGGLMAEPPFSLVAGCSGFGGGFGFEVF